MCLCLAVGAFAFNGKAAYPVDPIDAKEDFTCNRKGYVEYLSKWSVAQKSTSRDVNSEEFQTRLGYFIESCEKIHEWNKMKKYQMQFTFYADWHPEEFEELTTTKQRYSGVKAPVPSVIPVYNNTNYRYLMPSMDPCDQNTELRETISKPQNCSVSWAFAITNSIEYAIKKMYFEEYDQIVEVSLSAQELIDCVGKEHGVNGKMCDGMPLVWGFDYVYENGIAYSEYYPHTNVEGECKKIDDKKKYHIAGYEKPSAYNKLGLFDLVMKGPVAVTMGLDTEFFQYYRNDGEEGPYFNTGYWRPTVNGVVVEYSQYAANGESALSQNPYFAVETRLRGCDSLVFRVPILDTIENANIGGIAGFAIRPIVTDLIPVKPTSEVTVKPSVAPSVVPSVQPTDTPTIEPTIIPTESPTIAPTTSLPTIPPTIPSTQSPTIPPSESPTVQPTTNPTTQTPTTQPPTTIAPTTETPTIAPTTQTPTTIAPTTRPPVEIAVVPSELAPNPETIETVNITSGLCSSYQGSEFILRGLPALKSIVIGDHCFGKVRVFELDGLSELESVVIFFRSFWINSNERNGSYRIVNCPKLKSIYIDGFSFQDYRTFELNNLPSLQSIDMGDRCFIWTPSFSLISVIDGLV